MDKRSTYLQDNFSIIVYLGYIYYAGDITWNNFSFSQNS